MKPDAEARAAAVLQLIEQAADSGAPCPTNAELALAAGVLSGSMSRIIRHLVDTGAIVIDHRSRNRRVRVVATGRWTGWTSYAHRSAVAANRASGDRMPRIIDERPMRGLDFTDCPIAAVPEPPFRHLPEPRAHYASSADWAALPGGES